MTSALNKILASKFFYMSILQKKKKKKKKKDIITFLENITKKICKYFLKEKTLIC